MMFADLLFEAADMTGVFYSLPQALHKNLVLCRIISSNFVPEVAFA